MNFIIYTLLFVYIFPLFFTIIAFLLSEGFSISHPILLFMSALYSAYSSQIRDVLGTCLVPFIAANAIFSYAKSDQPSKNTKVLFLYLICVFILSVFVYCIISIQVETILSSFKNTDKNFIDGTRTTLLSVTDSYLKETLTFIALLLGVQLRYSDKDNLPATEKNA